MCFLPLFICEAVNVFVLLVCLYDSIVLYMALCDFSLDTKVEEIATLTPRSIKDKNILASDALQIIEDNKIQLLLILNNDETLYGALHIHKLIEAGIK